jgi:hypothetical protein
MAGAPRTVQLAPAPSSSSGGRLALLAAVRVAVAGAMLARPGDRDFAVATGTRAGVRASPGTDRSAIASLAGSVFDALANQPTTILGEIVKNPIASWKEGIGDVLSPLAAVGKFLAALLEVKTWIRVAEVGGGSLMLYLGVRAILQDVGGVTLPSPKGALRAVPVVGALAR